MFGLGDVSIAVAMIGSIAVTLVCVVYGIITWNRGDDSSSAASNNTPDRKNRS